MTLCRWFVNVILFLCIILVPFHGKAEQVSATDVIKTFNAALLESMKRADELGFSGRYKLLEPVIKESFAFPFMTKISVGRYWKTFQENQRKLLLETYTTWSIATYAARFNDYSGERMEVLSESESARGTITVISQLIEPNKEKVDFHYRLRMIKGKWFIVDIHTSGISQLALTRSQFLSVIRSKGFDALISKLQNKIEVLSKEEEH